MKKKEGKYPSIIFESSKIKALRIEVQKSFENEELVAFFILRPWSLFVSLFLVRFTNVTANSITFLMMALSFVFPVLLFFTTSLNSILIIAPLFFYFLYFLDIIDGEVARMRKKTSNLGKFYDASLWFTLPALFTVYIYKLSIFQSLPVWLFVVALITVMIETFILVSNTFFIKQGVLGFLNKKKSVLSKMILFFKFLLSKQSLYVLYPLLVLCINDTKNTAFYIFWVLIFCLYNGYNLIKFIHLKKKIETE